MFNKIDKIKKELENFSDTCFVVEGIKDKLVLETLGFKNIFTISNNSLNSIVEKIVSHKFKSVAILTDFDKEGENKFSQLTKLFKSYNITIQNSIRKLIKHSFKINKIEELKFVTKLLEDDYYGKTCSIYDKIFNRSRFLIRRTGRKARCYRSDIWSNRRIIGAGS